MPCPCCFRQENAVRKNLTPQSPKSWTTLLVSFCIGFDVKFGCWAAILPSTKTSAEQSWKLCMASAKGSNTACVSMFFPFCFFLYLHCLQTCCQRKPNLTAFDISQNSMQMYAEYKWKARMFWLSGTVDISHSLQQKDWLPADPEAVPTFNFRPHRFWRFAAQIAKIDSFCRLKWKSFRLSVLRSNFLMHHGGAPSFDRKATPSSLSMENMACCSNTSN